MLQQIAIVAGDLVNTAVGTKFQASLDHLAIISRMFDPRGREGGEVGVLREDVLGLHVLLQLYEEATVAHQGVQWIERLHRVDLIRSQEAFAERRHPEVHKARGELLGAQPAAPVSGFQRNRCRIGVRVHGPVLCKRLNTLIDCGSRRQRHLLHTLSRFKAF